jgi:hypothetical protein
MLSETTDSVRDWGQHQADRMHGMADRYRENAVSVVDDYPLSTTLGVFGVGLCLGVTIGAALARSHSHHVDTRQAAESLGRRVFDAVHEYMPKAVNQYLRG